MKFPENNGQNSQLGLFNNPASSISNTSAEDIFVSVLALSNIKGVGQKTIQAIYDLGIITDIWEMSLEELTAKISNVGKKNLDLPNLIVANKKDLFKKSRYEIEALTKKGITFIPSNDLSFPPALKTIKDPPRWLFVMGDPKILSSSGIIAIIGSRDASSDGTNVAYHLAKEMVCQNLIVLSGLAKGIDFYAHQGAIDYYGQTIGVLGHGFNAYYASSNEHLWHDIVIKDGAIISEYLPLESPSRENFLRRNELQAALAKIIIPVEVPDLASGTGATIRRALAQKKPILGVDVDKRESINLRKTSDNLKSLGAPIFTLPSQFEEFWLHLRTILKEHLWDVGTQYRQKRFYKKLFSENILMNNFLDEMRRASFSSNDVDVLSDEIKKRLGGDYD